ncbi:YiiX/YebB-like N1pC/P60 family cysteine hydrolase [Xylanibacillus composti]|uniref:YiiX/YebB-like N1pC/P60 family cysteine hydrolase n=1 Tax=Xylanibacillus composti TaxID=1572762 RepID=UPI001FD47552|nr:YiiX/YebB-like N1pC/P60 family cysteine hydrolase [Xylanibacillus composti]
MRPEFQAGDILVACDNALHVPAGYLGHSAIAVDGTYMVEAVLTFPYIRLVPIDQFFSDHRRMAVYRARDSRAGAAAAAFARWYYEQATRNYEQGKIVPPFSFSPAIALSDPWTSVYCSKLVWLSYYYGAGIALPNDFFLFTPEDIAAAAQSGEYLVTVYKHPEFQFVLNT